jgi:hypothetical protein
MHIKIRDRVFPVESASLSGSLADPYWCAKWGGGEAPKPGLTLEINASSVAHDEADWKPKLYHDWLTFPSRDWRHIANRTLTWRAEHDPDPSGCMYIFEHASVHASELRFGGRTGSSFAIEWRGVCDIFWDSSEYGEHVPFEAIADARFTDVLLHGSARDSDASFRKRFDLHFAVADFDQGPIVPGHGTYDDGVTMTSCRFTPRTES